MNNILQQEQSLYVRSWGQGERILLIHGSNVDNPEMLWLRQQDLASNYQLLIPDRRGYGQSPPCLESQEFEQNIADIVTLLASGSHIVGHSYGGLLAMVAAYRYPHLIKSLTIIEPPAFGLTIDQPIVHQVVRKLQSVYQTATTPETFLLGFLRAMGNDIAGPLLLSPQHRKGVQATMKETVPWHILLYPQSLAGCPFPKLVVSGDWHPALILTADLLTQLLQADRLIIRGVGHDIQKTGKPFNDRLASLIALSNKTL